MPAAPAPAPQPAATAESIRGRAFRVVSTILHDGKRLLPGTIIVAGEHMAEEAVLRLLGHPGAPGRASLAPHAPTPAPPPPPARLPVRTVSPAE